ncbi:MAG: lytic transglycosylase domain-containing protein [Acidobacteriaceae bacterium]|nr:lytic transglycosylase domain-containing protein [Acidobacteriaceae bacterium]
MPAVGGDAAFAAMEKSLGQQQAALDSFRETVQAGALSQQRDSVAKQVQPLRAERGVEARAISDTKPLTAGVSASAGTFFTLPWPGSLPLSIPNVQMTSDTCEAMGKAEIEKLIQGAAGKHGLSPDLLRSVMKQESGFKPCALSTAGAMGLMQIMPETADMLHLEDPFDPARNVDAGAKFLKTMLDRFGGDVPLALAAYNAGPGAVDKAGGIPPIAETLQYLTNILGDLPAAY